MLVLSRKVGQSLTMSNGVKIHVTHLDRYRVSIGIEAPQHIRVWRSELPADEPDKPLTEPSVPT